MDICGNDLSFIPFTEPTPHSQLASYLAQDLFCLMVQPIVNFQTGLASTAEVLSRLNHPENGYISVDMLISELEAAGLHSRFDLYIFQKCCLWLQDTATKGNGFDWISCNFSRKTLSQPGIAQELIRIADSCTVPCSKLGIEITERNPATDLHQIRKNLKQLKEAGFAILLDDYGSGVTAESDLYDFPLDVVKVDQSMLQNTDSETGKVNFRALVNKCSELGFSVVCEGIETEAQDRIARDAGCHYGQGFLYHKPAFPDRIWERIHPPFPSET